jgi:Arc/MetJ-type ribon-helix-helix transcriptional regulator
MEHLSVRLPRKMHRQIESSVKKGLFASQSEFIRSAVRKQLSESQETEAKRATRRGGS